MLPATVENALLQHLARTVQDLLGQAGGMAARAAPTSWEVRASQALSSERRVVSQCRQRSPRRRNG
jgi:hypothetical protein